MLRGPLDDLETFIIDMKFLDQDIADFVIAGEGDVNGRKLKVIFTQEAATQFAENTKIYLKWYHQQKKIQGYNIFNHVSDNPPTWDIYWPTKMLREGDVLCRIELVDSISIVPSENFIVHVLQDPIDSEQFEVSDDYSVFTNAVIELQTVTDDVQNILDELETNLSDLDEYKQIAADSALAADTAVAALEDIQSSLGEFPEQQTIKEYIDNQDDLILNRFTIHNFTGE